MNTSSTTVCQSIVYDGETLFYQGFALIDKPSVLWWGFHSNVYDCLWVTELVQTSWVKGYPASFRKLQ